MIKIKYFVYLLLVGIPAFCAILTRSTFEEYQGTTLEEMGWTKSNSVNGVVRLWQESGSEYQTQSHGKWSIQIFDPDNQNYAHVYKTFTNSAAEYMVEFYLWVGSDHTAPIDSFPLCVLKNMPGEGFPLETDIALVLDTLNTAHPYAIHVKDADSIYHYAAYIDSTDRWFKIQIYRHAGVVDLYLDGDSVGTFEPINPGYISNKIVLGTTQADSLADGEVFYDDVIISSLSENQGISERNISISGYQGNSESQRQKEALSFLSEANEYFSRINPYLIYQNYHCFTPGDIYYVMSLSNLLNTTFKNLSNYERLSYFNELIVKLDQIKLALLYGDLNKVERNILLRSLDFVVDKDNKLDSDLADKKERK